ncbi:Eco57I restriction-modification methylase domain-containing protein [Dendrosporobacter sp. 1207_IL3150]|uniref:Eco57I restriction-modification methylase domain-containing protein n=1 Tax=Dendrosporobacter sp. 1207_IL3150 TaxID=3084054 RepID=UPI002FDB0203
MTNLNWKKFTKDCKTILNWLHEGDYPEDIEIIIKVIAYIMKGEKQPDVILSSSIAGPALEDIFDADLSIIELLDIPDDILKIVGYWIHIIPRDVDFLGRAYEKLVSGRRIQGNYYTPDEAIGFILSHTVALCDIVENPNIRILDPACGCGYFLLQAYDILYHKFIQARELLKNFYPEMDLTDRGIHLHIISKNLWGADIDKTAASITAISLTLKSSDNCLSEIPHNIIVYDSLRRPNEGKYTKTIRAFWQSNYDYIIGNPPYISFGIRGSGKLEPEYRDYLRRSYADSAEYKLSYYVLFIQRGIELLKENGRLGYIIPDSFLLGRYYSKIRRYIMEKTVINTITHINCNVFANASTGYSTLCIFERVSDAQTRLNNKIKICKAESLGDLININTVCQYEQNYFMSLPYQRFRIFFDLKIKAIIEKIDHLGTYMKTYASGHTGIRSLTRQCEIIGLDKCGDSWKKGLISGSQITRYDIAYKGHWININPSLLYKGGWSNSIVEQRKLLIRQTGDTIIAGIDDNGYYHLNNIHSFVLKNDQITIDYLLLILNSKLMSFYYHVTTMEYGRSMAQTDIETLELLPIVVNKDINHQSSDLVKTMMECTAKSLAGDFNFTKRMKAFDEYLNQLVYRIYNLTEDDINHIEEFEASLAKRTRRLVRLSSE